MPNCRLHFALISLCEKLSQIFKSANLFLYNSGPLLVLRNERSLERIFNVSSIAAFITLQVQSKDNY